VRYETTLLTRIAATESVSLRVLMKN
jgi:hypothetical protein